MKRILSFFFLLMGAGMLSAQSSIIIFEQAEEVNLASSLGNKTYTLPAPGAKLRVDAKHTASGTTTDKNTLGNLVIEQKVNDTWIKIYEDCPGIVTEGDITLPVVGTVIGKKEVSVAYETLVLDLDRHATEIRLSNSRILVNAKQFCNLQVTMASFIEVNPHTLNMGEVVVGTGLHEAPVAVTYCNVNSALLSSNNTDFVLNKQSIQGAGIAQYDTDTVMVSFDPMVMGTHIATIIATDNQGHTDSCNVQIRVTKRTPVFTWQLPETFAVGDTIEAPMTSDCSNAMALTTCDGDKLLISCGMLIAKAPGEVEVQALQLGDEEYWYNHLETKTLTITGEVAAPDTIVVHDTIAIHDTIQIEVHDTIVVRDTIVVLDTVTVNNMTTEEKALLTIPTLYQSGDLLIANHEGMIGVAVYNVQGARVRTYEGDDYIEIPLDDLGSGYFVVSILTASEAYGIAIIIP